MRMSAERELAELLSEGLDLCVRARNLDEQIERALEVSMGSIFPEGTRCGTPALWIRDQYDNDLTEWEKKSRAAMLRLGFAR